MHKNSPRNLQTIQFALDNNQTYIEDHLCAFTSDSGVLLLHLNIDNIVQVEIRNSDIISVGTNSLMYGQSSLWV